MSERPEEFKPLGKVGRTGTGHIYDYSLVPGAAPGSQELELRIATAAHVVVDDAEVRGTTVELFYDDASRAGVVTARGCRMLEVQPSVSQGDSATFTARVTNPRKIRAVTSRLKATPYGGDPGTDVTFMVSHPHGLENMLALVQQQKLGRNVPCPKRL